MIIMLMSTYLWSLNSNLFKKNFFKYPQIPNTLASCSSSHMVRIHLQVWAFDQRLLWNQHCWDRMYYASMPAHQSHASPYRSFSLLAHPCWGPGRLPGGFWELCTPFVNKSTLKYWLWTRFLMCNERLGHSLHILLVPQLPCNDRSRSRKALSLVACWGWKLCGGASGRFQSVLLILDVDHLPVVE